MRLPTASLLVLVLATPAWADCPRPTTNNVNDFARYCSCMGGSVKQRSDGALVCEGMRSGSSGSSSSSAASDAMAQGLANLLSSLFSPPRRTNTVSRSSALNQQGVWAYEKKDWYKARDKFAEALRHEPNNSVIRRNLANSWAAIAGDAMKTYDYRRAIASLRESLNADPSLSSYQQWLNDLERQLNEDQEKLRQKAEEERQARLRGDLASVTTSAAVASVTSNDASVVDLRFMGEKPRVVEPASGSGPARETAPPEPEVAVETVLPPLELRIEAARKEVAGLQEALRRLRRSGELTESERAAWQKEIDDAGKRALKHGVDMIPGMLLDAAGERLTKALAAKTKEIDAALMQRINTTDPDARAEADQLFKRLSAERDELKEIIPKLERAERLATGAQALNNWESEDPEVSRQMLFAHQAFTEAVKDPRVLKALQVSGEAGKKYAAALTYGKDAVYSVYDVATQLVALKHMNNQLTTNAEEYLTAVNKLSQKLCQSTNRLVELKREAGQAPAGTGEAKCAN